MGQQQHRTTGGAGVGGSYGPTDNSSSDTSSNNSNMGQAGDASGVSRSSGGAGVCGSYTPDMMAEGARKDSQRRRRPEPAADAQNDCASPPCDLAVEDSLASKTLRAETRTGSSGTGQGEFTAGHEPKSSSSGDYRTLQSEAVLPESRQGNDQGLRSKL